MPRTGVLPLGSLCVPLNCNTCKSRVFRFVLIIPYGHTFATLAIQQGVDAKTVSSILGHYSAGFTLDTYTHVTGEMQKDAAQRMGSFMAQQAE